jgi:hypothetical protein
MARGSDEEWADAVERVEEGSIDGVLVLEGKKEGHVCTGAEGTPQEYPFGRRGAMPFSNSPLSECLLLFAPNPNALSALSTPPRVFSPSPSNRSAGLRSETACIPIHVARWSPGPYPIPSATSCGRSRKPSTVSARPFSGRSRTRPDPPRPRSFDLLPPSVDGARSR